MSPESFLASSTEVAIGMAGFAGIIAAIRQRGVSNWPPRQRLLLQALFGASAAALSFSLAPAILLEAGLSASMFWRIGSASIIAMMMGATVFRRMQTKRLGTPFTIPMLLAAWVFLVICVQMVNVLWLATAWPYLLGIFGLLVNGFVIFLMLLLDPSEESSPEP